MSDYGKWFISTDRTHTAVKCKREKFMDCLIETFGRERASKLFSQFRRATFSENCRLEIESMEG